MNINGYCPHCNSDMDGELIVDTFIKQGKIEEEAIKYASNYAGWDQYGIDNRWSRKIGLYDLQKDRTIKYKCPDCNEEWEKE